MSNKSTADPLGSLLSNLNGIDSSLFEHKALKDIDKADNGQIHSGSGSAHSWGSPETGISGTDKAINRSPAAGPNRPTQAPSAIWGHNSSSMSSRAKGSQFDALLGDLALGSSARCVPYCAPAHAARFAQAAYIENRCSVSCVDGAAMYRPMRAPARPQQGVTSATTVASTSTMPATPASGAGVSECL